MCLTFIGLKFKGVDCVVSITAIGRFARRLVLLAAMNVGLGGCSVGGDSGGDVTPTATAPETVATTPEGFERDGRIDYWEKWPGDNPAELPDASFRGTFVPAPFPWCTSIDYVSYRWDSARLVDVIERPWGDEPLYIAYPYNLKDTGCRLDTDLWESYDPTIQAAWQDYLAAHPNLARRLDYECCLR